MSKQRGTSTETAWVAVVVQAPWRLDYGIVSFTIPDDTRCFKRCDVMLKTRTFLWNAETE